VAPQRLLSSRLRAPEMARTLIPAAVGADGGRAAVDDEDLSGRGYRVERRVGKTESGR
jgi:hypothetical protein